MINAILKGIFKLVTSLVTLLLGPIDTIISNALPSLQVGINAIGQFLTLATQSIGWVLSVFGLSSECLSLIGSDVGVGVAPLPPLPPEP